MTVADVSAGHALSRAAGWNQRAEDWTRLLSGNAGRFVAAVEPDGRVVGTAGAACYGQDLAWICMVLVDAAARGQGIGTRLMEEVLGRVADVHVVGLDATPLGRPVYAKLGFREGATFLRMGAAGGGGGAPHDPALELTAAGMDEVLALDREVFGADRSHVLGWARDRAPAWCLREEGRVTAYSFARAGEHSWHIGPIVARTPAAATRLLATARSAVTGRVIVDVAAGDPSWIAGVTALGFTEQRPLLRMYRGTTPPPGRPALQFAIFGPEFG